MKKAEKPHYKKSLERLKALEAKAAQDHLIFTEDQLRALEKAKSLFKIFLKVRIFWRKICKECTGNIRIY
ncbi:hypothetical protein RHABOEDO_000858 [Candidatus Rhabdochlamydia oedothoracis]|uniref:Transposase n=1 Tax=Candidatus Rhabdochlamydia oedothoracis TaxID=2720720 RepID=A0ABX8V0B0_9BACT|nr:hypothetical protein RHABOEDO_000858 [Candidatus Rhabdochlamydia oedothoracis]